ncbi:MAG: 50S ribosomal protein L11 methyltransferase [Pseudomonadota bacterium]|nr:50S ribosomal protein L11 methyltransferase [Pseudomonadota bacterium]MDE3038499.1 50S ribosomal protein L11 methyltransferase [Pseudomonadota bacterium]
MPITLDGQNLHPATELMLEALEWLHERHDAATALDLGCGGGILSALAASVWGARVLAADIAAKAVEDTRKNMAAHGLERLVTAVRSDGFSAPEIRANAPYDLIFINLLAEPIVRWAGDVKSHLAENGVAALGGILAWQAEGAALAYTGLGFEIINEFARPPWYACLLRAPAARH